MKWPVRINLALATVATLFGMAGAPAAKAQDKKPNILVSLAAANFSVNPDMREETESP
jgi:hypothetical protein